MSEITVKVTEADPKNMYLRTVWATGTTQSGRAFEVAQSNVTIVLTLGAFGEDRVVDHILIEDLVTAWLASKGES